VFTEVRVFEITNIMIMRIFHTVPGTFKAFEILTIEDFAER
jgi:hypothetical protein